jgi:hypothetical protein
MVIINNIQSCIDIHFDETKFGKTKFVDLPLVRESGLNIKPIELILDTISELYTINIVMHNGLDVSLFNTIHLLCLYSKEIAKEWKTKFNTILEDPEEFANVGFMIYLPDHKSTYIMLHIDKNIKWILSNHKSLKDALIYLTIQREAQHIVVEN